MLIKVVFILIDAWYKSEYFGITQCVAQGCTLSPTLFLIFVDGLMKEIESEVSFFPLLELNGLLFAGDFCWIESFEARLTRYNKCSSCI